MIGFSKPTTFLGRNGLFTATGLTFLKTSHKGVPTVVMEPITSRGVLGRGHLEIPVEDIPALIAELQKFTPQTCKKCGSDLVHDRCTDETCPYSDREQSEEIQYDTPVATPA